MGNRKTAVGTDGTVVRSVDLIGCKLDMNISEENTSTYMDEKKYV